MTNMRLSCKIIIIKYAEKCRNEIVILPSCVLMFAVLIPVTPFVIRLLYPSVADSAAPYYLWANAGQIVYFVANLLLVIALRFLSERFQLFVNLGYTVLYLALCVPCLMQGDLMRFMQCALLANVIRFVVIVCTGLFKTKEVSV